MEPRAGIGPALLVGLICVYGLVGGARDESGETRRWRVRSKRFRVRVVKPRVWLNAKCSTVELSPGGRGSRTRTCNLLVRVGLRLLGARNGLRFARWRGGAKGFCVRVNKPPGVCRFRRSMPLPFGYEGDGAFSRIRTCKCACRARSAGRKRGARSRARLCSRENWCSRPSEETDEGETAAVATAPSDRSTIEPASSCCDDDTRAVVEQWLRVGFVRRDVSENGWRDRVNGGAPEKISVTE